MKIRPGAFLRFWVTFDAKKVCFQAEIVHSPIRSRYTKKKLAKEKDMQKQTITRQNLHAFALRLREGERSAATIEKYLREAARFSVWLGKEPLTKSVVARWKEHLLQAGYSPTTVNGKLTALDQMLLCLDKGDCRVKHVKIQRRLFREDSRELTREEYLRLLGTAKRKGRERLALLMETICATGIRVSEVRFITLAAVQKGRAEIALKGKIRTILLPGKLCRKLLRYAKKNKIFTGTIFQSRNGSALSRKQIWAEMKSICREAGVSPSKVFPHNLRHLFARTFYRVSRDVAKLADVLGHSSIETTRIYLISTGAEHARTMERLQLIS